MAKTYDHIYVHWLKEETGDSVGSYKTCSGRTISTRKSMFDDERQFTETRKTPQAVIRAAAKYANFSSTQKIYVNRERNTDATAYTLAIADWFCPPKVLEINVDGWTGEIGQTIRVKAKDNMMVARVLVVIRDADDHVLESGEAVRSPAGNTWWHYTTKSRVNTTPFPTIEAIACDLPGNIGSFIIS